MVVVQSTTMWKSKNRTMSDTKKMLEPQSGELRIKWVNQWQAQVHQITLGMLELSA